MSDHKFEDEHRDEILSEFNSKITSDVTSSSKDKVKVGVATKDGQLGFLFTRGGLREGAGRKSTGITKKVSLTLPENIWQEIEQACEEQNVSRSQVFRNIIEAHFAKESKES
ncbi:MULTISPECIES: ribbon-helix-helix domain-containing protein [Paenibacillus]|uniref:ribbon-helix-helix domain-containing protein n=1 Tax=Paenibacillus TaxID=44249 RepID=UPI0021168A70|nr:ribbon-helix-helix domain-containing protein [Paenibacillus odorifer]